MSVSIHLWSKEKGEIKKFLKKYYQKEIYMEEDIENWIYVYSKPLESIDIISTLMDNLEEYNISMYLQIDKYDVHNVTSQNYNDVIKGLFQIYYDESSYKNYI